jgi:hypothetical protein
MDDGDAAKHLAFRINDPLLCGTSLALAEKVFMSVDKSTELVGHVNACHPRYACHTTAIEPRQDTELQATYHRVHLSLVSDH